MLRDFQTSNEKGRLDICMQKEPGITNGFHHSEREASQAKEKHLRGEFFRGAKSCLSRKDVISLAFVNIVEL